jgi:hypothetical protein
VRVFSQLPVEAFYPLREFVIYVSFKTGHVITLYSCGTDFGIHNVIACV